MGFYVYTSNSNRVQRYGCLQCKRSFPSEYSQRPAQNIDVSCPNCGSDRTVKQGSPIQRKYNTVQVCRCKDCRKSFTLGGRKKRLFFLKGKIIHKYWDPPGLKLVPDVSCPNCSQQKAALKTKFYDNQLQREVRYLICLGCGQAFKGEGRAWENNTHRRLGKEVPRRPWHFYDDSWDLRELYPGVEEYKFDSLFLNFSGCGASWFKQLVKKYILWRVESGSKYSTVNKYIYILGFLGRFLKQRKITSMKVNRLLLATYWTQELGHISRGWLNEHMGTLKHFFNWGNAEQHFAISSTVITSFDRPLLFFDDPDPLEESALEGIRDNLYVLPEPIQLMFMLGFWLGTRPSELNYIRKDCLKLDLDGSLWWVEFERKKSEDEHRLPITTDLVHLIHQQQNYITQLWGEEYPYLFCHYQEFGKAGYPNYPRLRAMKRPPMVIAKHNPMVKGIRHLIEHSEIKDSNGKLVNFTGQILRPSRATYLIRNGFSLEFIRIWLKHRHTKTTKRHYTRYRPGDLLDVACIMANLDGNFVPYDSDPESLRRNPKLHELDGLQLPSGEPLYGYCTFREFCPRFGHCYTCGFHVASSDKLPQYKAQLERLRAKRQEVFNYGSSEMLESYTVIVNALEGKIAALEAEA